jgi:hypothetical protein
VIYVSYKHESGGQPEYSLTQIVPQAGEPYLSLHLLCMPRKGTYKKHCFSYLQRERCCFWEQTSSHFELVTAETDVRAAVLVHTFCWDPPSRSLCTVYTPPTVLSRCGPGTDMRACRHWASCITILIPYNYSYSRELLGRRVIGAPARSSFIQAWLTKSRLALSTKSPLDVCICVGSDAWYVDSWSRGMSWYSASIEFISASLD